MFHKIPKGSKIIGKKYGELVWETPDGYKLMVASDSNAEPDSISRYNQKLGSLLDLKSDFLPSKDSQVIELASPGARFEVELDSVTSPDVGNNQGSMFASRNGIDGVKYDLNTPDNNLIEDKKTGITMSSKGADYLIRDSEGFKDYLHNDPAGHCSIGWGKLVHYGNCNATHSAEQPYLNGITKKEAETLFRNSISEAEMVVNDLVKVELGQNQFDALVSFVYNLGRDNFRKSTLLKVINKGEFDKVVYQLNRWIKANEQILPGLVERRKKEGNMFNSK